jgi:prepilin-type N-terminal cleavage/methylation domain-containing protein
MKRRFSNQSRHAVTLVELLVVIVVLAVLVVVLLPTLVPHSPRRMQSRINCINNLHQIGFAYKSWEGDNADKFPMQVSVTLGGSMEMAATGNVTQTFLVMSNELSTPKVLYCSFDNTHFVTNSFAGLTSSNISYFVGVDASDVNPQMILSGDANLEINGVPVKSGLLKLTQHSPVSWASGRHMTDYHVFFLPVHNEPAGNIGLDDGSVQQVNTAGLQSAFSQTDLATNRLAIP